MTRVIIRFKDGEHINIPGEAIDFRDEWVMAWQGNDLVALVKAEDVCVCYLSEKKET